MTSRGFPLCVFLSTQTWRGGGNPFSVVFWYIQMRREGDCPLSIVSSSTQTPAGALLATIIHHSPPSLEHKTEGHHTTSAILTWPLPRSNTRWKGFVAHHCPFLNSRDGGPLLLTPRSTTSPTLPRLNARRRGFLPESPPPPLLETGFVHPKIRRSNTRRRGSFAQHHHHHLYPSLNTRHGRYITNLHWHHCHPSLAPSLNMRWRAYLVTHNLSISNPWNCFIVVHSSLYPYTAISRVPQYLSHTPKYRLLYIYSGKVWISIYGGKVYI